MPDDKYLKADTGEVEAIGIPDSAFEAADLIADFLEDEGGCGSACCLHTQRSQRGIARIVQKAQGKALAEAAKMLARNAEAMQK